MKLSEAADMGFIDNGKIPWYPTATRRTFPIKIGIDDNAFRHERRAVAIVETQIVPGLHLVSKDRRVPRQLAEIPLGIGVEQQLVGIEAVPGLRLVRTMDPVAIDRARSDVRNITVPDFVGEFWELDSADLLFPFAVEDAYLDLSRVR